MSTATHLLRHSRQLRTTTQRLAFSSSAPSLSGKVKEIVSKQEWEDLMKTNATEKKNAVIEFTAAWCPPCRQIAPVVDDLASKHTQVSFVKLDIDNKSLLEIVASFSVSAVPTFVSMVGDKQITTFSGADRAQLTRMVQELSGS